jgi:hypothetical protein
LPLSLLDYRAACHNISWCVVRTTWPICEYVPRVNKGTEITARLVDMHVILKVGMLSVCTSIIGVCKCVSVCVCVCMCVCVCVCVCVVCLNHWNETKGSNLPNAHSPAIQS